MKTPLLLVYLALSIIARPLLPAAETKLVPPPTEKKAVGAKSPAGSYAGSWKGPQDTSGDLRIVLKQDEAGTWAAEAKFTFEGAEISTRMKLVRVEGSTVQLAFNYEIQGTAGESRVTGEWQGDTLQGTYESKAGNDGSKGTWRVTRK